MEKKVSEFAGRRSPAPGSVPAKDQPAPIGTDAGSFKRNPCGTCWHWQRNPAAGLDVGVCMAGPPTPYMVPGPDGRPRGQMLVRPTPTASSEGCDLWDDETDFEGDGEESELSAVG